ncbi:MAG TPA: hypothetical protein VK589_31490 [Chryseolinea sp.]|nr:hypothetical protein [Chryseolinea sp.]
MTALFRKIIVRLTFLVIVVMLLSSWKPADFLQDLQQKYDAFRTKYPTVKLYCILNQPVYSPGDTVFFQCWYMNDEFTRVKGEHIVTLDLFNGEGRAVQKMKFKVKNGTGHSQFVVDPGVKPGDYKIVGHTEWMRNFKSSGYYQKMIRIESTKEIETSFKKTDVLKFFPEGGNLVGGTANKIAVLGPPSAVLQLSSPADSAVTVVSLDSTGLGNFTLTPEPGVRYYAEWPAGGRRWPLPVSEKDGVSLMMEATGNPEFLLSAPAGSQLIDKEIYAVVVSQGKIKFRQAYKFDETRSLRVNVPLQAMDKAVHEMVIFGSAGEILARRLFFLKGADNFTAKLNVSPSVGQRGRVTGAVQIMDESGRPLDCEVNVLVYQSNLFNYHTSASGFYLSDLSAADERARRYNIRDNFLLNDFLITQTVDVFDWRDVLNNRTIPLTFPFYSEAKLRGKLVSKKTGEAPPDSTAVIGYLQKNTVGYEAYTRDGNFEMTLIYDFWGADLIFCTLRQKNKSVDGNYDVIVLEDSIKSIGTWTSIEKDQRAKYGEYALNRSIVSKSYLFFGNEGALASAAELSPNSIFEDEFRGVDYSVNVEEYMTFPSMADFLQEAVPFVRYRKKGDKETVRMSYRYDKTLKIFKEDPLYIIDGLMTRNTDYFLSLKPEQLLFIKILNNPNKLTQLGKLGENAVIFVESKKGDLYKGIELENIFPVTGLSRSKEFFEADHSQAGVNDRIPDLRSTLYWKPFIETKSGTAEFNFFAGDDIGPMKVVVTGFTKDGRPFSVEKEVNVVFDAEAR